MSNPSDLFPLLLSLAEREGFEAAMRISDILEADPTLVGEGAGWERKGWLAQVVVRRIRPPMLLADAIDDFHELKQGCSKGARKNYRLKLAHFLEWVESHHGPDPCLHDVTPALAREWTGQVQAKRMGASQKNHEVGVIRTFFNFAVQSEAMDKSPFDWKWERPSTPAGRQNVRIWSHAQVLKLLRLTICRRPDLVAVAATMLLLGIPHWILAGLRLEDFRWNQGLLVVRAAVNQARTDRFIPLPEHFQEWFRGTPAAGPLCHLQVGGLKRAMSVLRREAGLRGRWKIEMITAISHWIGASFSEEKVFECRGLSAVEDPKRYQTKVPEEEGKRFIASRPPTGWFPLLPYSPSKEKRSCRPWNEVMKSEIPAAAWEDYIRQTEITPPLSPVPIPPDQLSGA
jgi:integrase